MFLFYGLKTASDVKRSQRWIKRGFFKIDLEEVRLARGGMFTIKQDLL